MSPRLLLFLFLNLFHISNHQHTLFLTHTQTYTHISINSTIVVNNSAKAAVSMDHCVGCCASLGVHKVWRDYRGGSPPHSTANSFFCPSSPVILISPQLMFTCNLKFQTQSFTFGERSELKVTSFFQGSSSVQPPPK